MVVTIPASFDEVARELTVTAARRAGLPKIVLLEEPQAAFYAWMARHADAAGDDDAGPARAGLRHRRRHDGPDPHRGPTRQRVGRAGELPPPRGRRPSHPRRRQPRPRAGAPRRDAPRRQAGAARVGRAHPALPAGEGNPPRRRRARPLDDQPPGGGRRAVDRRRAAGRTHPRRGGGAAPGRLPAARGAGRAAGAAGVRFGVPGIRVAVRGGPGDHALRGGVPVGARRAAGRGAVQRRVLRVAGVARAVPGSARLVVRRRAAGRAGQRTARPRGGAGRGAVRTGPARGRSENQRRPGAGVLSRGARRGRAAGGGLPRADGSGGRRGSQSGGAGVRPAHPAAGGVPAVRFQHAHAATNPAMWWCPTRSNSPRCRPCAPPCADGPARRATTPCPCGCTRG